MQRSRLSRVLFCASVGLVAAAVASPLVSHVRALAEDAASPAHDHAAEGKDKKTPEEKQAEAKRLAEYYELFEVFADTMDQVERNYVKDVSRRELMEAAIAGVLSKLDPYSSYISPDDLGRFKTSVDSQFGGVGIQITMENDQIKILSPLVGTPAYKAGLQAGDLITDIDGKPAEGLSMDEAIRRMKGDVGASVTLTVVHAGQNKKMTVTLKREVIRVDTVLGDHRDAKDAWDFFLDHDKHIGYIRVTAFSRDTADDLKKALDALQKQGLKGLVLDLRFNPGGLLTAAVEVSDMFVADGRIVSTQGRNTPERTWEARKEGTYEGFPIAVLVNRYSASASEILSACMQDHHVAKVIGERTWGKGSVQNVIELENGKSALKLTTASYKRPNGHNIHRFPGAKDQDEWGVMPDSGYEVRLSDEEMGRLVRDRRDRDIVAVHEKAAEADAGATKPSDPNAAGEKTKMPDRQLEKALDYLSGELARAN